MGKPVRRRFDEFAETARFEKVSIENKVAVSR